MKDDPHNLQTLNLTNCCVLFVRCNSKPHCFECFRGIVVNKLASAGGDASESLPGVGQSENNLPIKNTVSLVGQESTCKHFGQN